MKHNSTLGIKFISVRSTSLQHSLQLLHLFRHWKTTANNYFNSLLAISMQNTLPTFYSERAISDISEISSVLLIYFPQYFKEIIFRGHVNILHRNLTIQIFLRYATKNRTYSNIFTYWKKYIGLFLMPVGGVLLKNIKYIFCFHSLIYAMP